VKPATTRFPHNLSVDETAHTTAPATPLALPVPRDLGEVAWRIGVALCTAASAVFVVVQMHAWPPHEDETLALFTGRSSVHDLITTVLGERGGAPLHFLLAWVVAHSGGGLMALRSLSAVFGLASIPLIAILVRRLSDRATALVATALVAPSWMLLFHAIYGRMYALFLFTSTLSYLGLLRALERRDRWSWVLWAFAMLACLATHPYGALVLGSQGLYVLLARRVRAALPAFVCVFVLATPFWRADLVLGGRFDVTVGGGGAKLAGPEPILGYLTRVAGDFTAGWLPTRIAILVAAGYGLYLLTRTRRASAVLTLTSVAVPLVFFLLISVGSGLASPESRHLIFVLPFFAMCLALPIVRLARSSLPEAVPLAVVAILSIAALEVGWGMHKVPLLYNGEAASRTQARADASSWLARTARPDDILFGYEPLFLGAWERNRDFSDTVVPRADTKLALRVLYRAPKPLGRGIWVLDASDTNNFQPKLHIKLRYPAPSAKYEVRVFGPFLVVRSRKPTRTVREFLLETRAVQFVGEDLYIGDSDINLLTVERALDLRGLGGVGGPR
jgi:hypothetical protein